MIRVVPFPFDRGLSSSLMRRRPDFSVTRHAAVRALVVFLLLFLGSACRTLSYPPGGPVCVGEPGAAVDSDPSLRIVSYNVAYARRVDLAIEALTQAPLVGADILALQEMDAPGVEAIGRKLGYGWVYFPVTVHPKSKRDFGNALLSPWPMRNVRKLMLPHKSLIYNQSRAATVADIAVAGREMRVYSTHLGAPLGTSGGRRKDQIETILADAKNTSLPVIILGDFNSLSIAQYVSTQGYTFVTAHIAPTTNRFRFDHILVRGLPEAEGASAGTWSEGPKASDHHPIWAVLPPVALPTAGSALPEATGPLGSGLAPSPPIP
jgi:endonuclease/exonuclease/phosphatase family metal-dependent hydrolase